MRKILHLLLVITFLGGLAWVLWTGVRKQAAKPEDADDAPLSSVAEEETKPAEFVVMLEKEKASALAIEKEQPVKMELQARLMVCGSVLDPSPLVTLDADLATAEAALAASKAENERTLALVATKDASKKAADAAQAQFLADQIKLEGLIRGASMQWGEIFKKDAASRRSFAEELVTGAASLARVDVMPGDALAEMPKSAHLFAFGREMQAMEVAEIYPAQLADSKTQAQGFLLLIKKPPFLLRPGMALTAWLDLPGKVRPGFALPRSAILRHDGSAWIYVQEENEKYVRKSIVLDSPLEGGQGWFILDGAGLSADDVIVVAGASSLLSEELKAQGGGDEE